MNAIFSPSFTQPIASNNFGPSTTATANFPNLESISPDSNINELLELNLNFQKSREKAKTDGHFLVVLAVITV